MNGMETNGEGTNS